MELVVISKLLGLLNKIIYKIRFGKSIHFRGIPRFVSHLQIYVKSGKLTVGKNVTIKQGVYIATVDGGIISIGNNCSFNRNDMLVSHESITIGDNVAVGPNTVFYDHDHIFGASGLKPGFKTAPIVIEKNCWIGAGVTILKGTHIGEGSVIGAGCIVKGEIPAHSLVTSNRELNITPITAKE